MLLEFFQFSLSRRAFHLCKKGIFFKTKTETKVLIFFPEAPRDQDSVLEDNITGVFCAYISGV